MDKRLRVYLDTSVPNFLFAEDAPKNRIRIVNLELGYRLELRIVTPLELLDYGN